MKLPGAAPRVGPSRALHGLLHAGAGVLLVVAGWALGALPGIAVHWAACRLPLVGAGFVLALLGFCREGTVLARGSRAVCLVTISTVLGIACLESGFRVAGVDFRRQAARLASVPPFYRRPDVPTGPVFFRREGPLEWHGPVIRRMLEGLGLDSQPYAEEPDIRVQHDRLGFRNEPHPPDWEVAVAGDSFTELGHLAFADLFTTRLAVAGAGRVLNLGVANTGPLSHLHYLREYGRAPATRDVVIVFFEGNDLADLAIERAAELRFERTGQRGSRSLRPQTSFLRAVGEWWRRPAGTPASAALPVEAHLRLGGCRVPVTVGEAPGSYDTWPEPTREALGRFVQQYGSLAREQEVRGWLVFLPCKRRTWHGRLDFTRLASEETRAWEPSDLPVVLAGLCAREGLRFLDLTPALRAALEVSGDAQYNALYDSHLDAAGARTVAEALRPGLAGN